MSLIDENGCAVDLGPQLTIPGGEGAIYKLANDPTKVAKIYHKQANSQKTAKLRHLRTIVSKNLLGVSAWPINLLYDATSRDTIKGFLMPLVAGKEIHKLYGPHDRACEFPWASWDFLVHVAKNSAAAFETLHDYDIIIADVNEKNILVTHEGIVRLIDCDSYQIKIPSTVFNCDVGVPLWTPPELQGRDFRSLVRTKNHDLFGLAVLIFHLLFMGRHPFAGVPDRPEQFDIEKAIGQFLFAFSSKTRSLGVQPPPNALLLSDLPDNIIKLFERAFLKGSEINESRPTGREWYIALDLFEKNLRGCSRDPGHKYSTHLGSCPWCKIYDDGGPNFFYSIIFHIEPKKTASNIPIYWSAIEQTRLRGITAKGLKEYAFTKISGTPLTQNISKIRPEFYFGLILILISFPLLFAVGWWAVLGILAGWGAVSEGSISNEYSAEVNRRKLVRDQLNTEVEKSIQEANQIVEDYQKAFLSRKTELGNVYQRYSRHEDEKRQEMQMLNLKKREIQLNEYLDGIIIRDHDIPEIKSRRKQILAAYGIESAFDISISLNIPGFGQHLKSILLDWKSKCVNRFIYNSLIPLPQKVIQEFNLRMANLRQSLEVELRGGPQKLNEITMLAERKLKEREDRTAQIVQKYAQAEADFEILVNK